MTAPPVTSRRFTTPAGQLAAVHCAPPEDTDRGIAVVLVGGLAGSKEDFLPLLPLLARAGYHAYAYDHRGQYESDGPDSPDAYTLHTLADDLRSILAQIDHPYGVHLAGLCMGGFVARHAAMSAPGVASLALVGCPLGVSLGTYLRLRALALSCRIIGPTRTARMVIDRFDKARPDEALDTATADVARVRLTRTRPAHYFGLVRSWARVRHDGPLPAAPVPTLLLHGAKDSLFPTRLYVEAARRTGATYMVVPQAGHSAHQHRPEAVARAMQGFWQALPVPDPAVRPGRPAAGVLPSEACQDLEAARSEGPQHR